MGTITKEKAKYRVRWKKSDGTRGSRYFTTHSAARRALAKFEAEAEEVRVGLRLEATPEHTFDELCDYWLEHRASRKKSDKHDRSIVHRHLRLEFGHLKVHEVTLEKVDQFRRRICPDERDFGMTLKERRKRGVVSPKTLHNVLTLLISMLNLAVDLNWIGSRPNIKKPKLPKAAFSYLRTADDIKKLLLAAKNENEGVFDLY